MKKRILVAGAIIIALSYTMNAQHAGVWNNHTCAVVLTYDDGLNVHLDKVIPSLDKYGLKGTFYIPGNAATLDNRINDWRAAAVNGHELGNHTLFHPCSGEGRSWVSKDYDLDTYTITRAMDEIRTANKLLKAIDGKSERTFAYTCGNMNAGNESFYGLIGNDFISARGVASKFESIDSIDIYNVGAFMAMNSSGEQMINLVKTAMKEGKLLVFLFHGVGGEHNINVDLEEHNKLLEFLYANQKDIWVASYLDVTKYIKQAAKK